MTECIVIADEITGGSSVGAMLEANGSSVMAVMSARGLKDPLAGSCDCLVYATNSRNLTPQQSYQIVFYAARLLKKPEVRLYAKRIDPSMRGNNCAEIQALLDALGDSDRVAVVVPAFPALKRSTVGGYILVDGKPFQKSLAGMEDMDLLTPARSGRVADLFSEKFRYPTAALHLKEFLKGTQHLAQTFRELAGRGTRAIVMDCTSQEEINMIADAVLQSGIKFLAVDPGPFTATLARKILRRPAPASPDSVPRIFGIVGGHNPLIAAQVELLRLEEKALLVTIHNLELLSAEEHRRTEEINRVAAEIIAHYDQYAIAFAVSDFMLPASTSRQDYQETLLKTNRTPHEALDIVSAAYGEITHNVLLRRPDIRALYTTGAEYTVAVCRELKSMGIKILGQVLPLTCYGELLDGEYRGLKCVTSASSATDANTITDSLQYLKRKLAI